MIGSVPADRSAPGTTRSAAQQRLAEEVRTAVASLPHAALPRETGARFAALVDVQRHLHRAGLVTYAWPERFGGRGLAPADVAVVADELGRCRAPELANFVGVDILAPALMRFADDSRLARWLPPMATAGEVWCQLFSEPDAGSDLASLRTKAIRSDGGWTVRGQKVWSTWAQFARFGLLLARTGARDSRHRGITAFVVDMRSPGVTVRPLRTMTGADEFCEVFLDDVVVSDADRVGEVDGGWAVALHILVQERGPYAVRRASVIRATLDDVLERGRRARLDPIARQPIVDAVLAMRVLERRIDTVLRVLADGRDLGPEAAVTKLLLTDAEQKVFAAGLELLGSGALGWSDAATEDAVEGYLYSRAASIYGGTREIQHNIIAERLLGLPRA